MSIGAYIVCSAGVEADRKRMWLPQDYCEDGWNWLWNRVKRCAAKGLKLGETLVCVVVKYFGGQGTDHKGQPSPKLLDMLSLADRVYGEAIISDEDPRLCVPGMRSLEQRCANIGVGVLYYVGRLPTIEEQEDMSLTDWRDLTYILSLSRAGWIFDSSNYPGTMKDTAAFVRNINRHGMEFPFAGIHCGEAFPSSHGKAWPGREGDDCYGEDLAFHNRTRTNDPYDQSLLYGGSKPPDHLPANQWVLNAREALNAGNPVYMPLDVMKDAEIGEILNPKETNDGQG